MAEFYAKKILDGSMTVDDVPKLWRDKVRERVAKTPNKEQESSKE